MLEIPFDHYRLLLCLYRRFTRRNYFNYVIIIIIIIIIIILVIVILTNIILSNIFVVNYTITFV